MSSSLIKTWRIFLFWHGFCIYVFCKYMEDVVQLVEYHIVAVRVMGSNPIILPKNNKWRVGRVDDCGGLENR